MDRTAYLWPAAKARQYSRRGDVERVQPWRGDDCGGRSRQVRLRRAHLKKGEGNFLPHWRNRERKTRGAVHALKNFATKGNECLIVIAWESCFQDGVPTSSPLRTT